MTTASIGRWTKANWFAAALPVLLLIEFAFSRMPEARAAPTLLEATVLFDLCVFVPGLFLLCYRRRLGRKALAVRVLGLACFGILLASWMVPAGAQTLIPHLRWPRMVGMAVLAIVELKLLVEVLKLVFGGADTTEAIAERSGLPPALVKLMALEARFWKAVWRTLRGR